MEHFSFNNGGQETNNGALWIDRGSEVVGRPFLEYNPAPYVVYS